MTAASDPLDCMACRQQHRRRRPVYDNRGNVCVNDATCLILESWLWPLSLYLSVGICNESVNCRKRELLICMFWLVTTMMAEIIPPIKITLHSTVHVYII